MLTKKEVAESLIAEICDGDRATKNESLRGVITLDDLYKLFDWGNEDA